MSLCFIGFALLLITLAGDAGAASGRNFIRIKSSSIGGSWYAGGSAWAKLIADNYPEFLTVNIAAPGLDNESLKRLFRNEAELVFLTGPGAYNAYKGVPPVWKEPMPLRGLFGIWPGVLNTVVSAESKFQVLQDLKGAKIATYVPGDINGEQMLALLKHHGVTEENTKIFKIMKADAARMFIDGAIDAVVYYYGYGHANLKEMSASRKIRFLPNDPVKVQAFMKENPFYYIARFRSGVRRSQCEAAHRTLSHRLPRRPAGGYGLQGDQGLVRESELAQQGPPVEHAL